MAAASAAAALVLLLLTSNVCASFGHALVNPAEDEGEWPAGMSMASEDEESPDEGQLEYDTIPEGPDQLMNQLHLAVSSISQYNGTPADENAGDIATAISALTAAVMASSARVDQQIMQLRQDNTAQIEAAVEAVQKSFASLSSIATIAMENQAAVAEMQKSVDDLQRLLDEQVQLKAEEGAFSTSKDGLFEISTSQPKYGKVFPWDGDGIIGATPSMKPFQTQATIETKKENKLGINWEMHQEDIAVNDVVIPEQVVVGSTALLECRWSGYPIYSLRWFKDDENIFTIIPEADDKLKYDGIPGVTVDVESSDMQILALRDVSEATSGIYKCEVVGEAPRFEIKYAQRQLQVKEASTTPPVIQNTLTTVRPSVIGMSENEVGISSPGWCEEPGFIVSGSCFRIVSSVRRSWRAARKYCQDLDAKLAMPENIRWFAKHLRERPNKEGKGRFWLGASFSDNGWEWNSNKDFKQGKIKLPSTSSKGDCLFIAPHAKYILKAKVCKSVEAFICQSFQPQALLASTAMPPPPPPPPPVVSTTTSPQPVPTISVSTEAAPDFDTDPVITTITFTDPPQTEINTTLPPIFIEDNSIASLVTKTARVLKAQKTAIDAQPKSAIGPPRPIFTECKPPYFQVGSECFRVHLKPYTRHEAESVCMSTDGSFLATPDNIGLLRDHLYNLQDLEYQVEYWLGSLAWVHQYISNISIPGEDLLPQYHNWCPVFTPGHCPYLAIDHCHNRKPVICQVTIETYEFTTEIPFVECPPSSFQLGSQCFQYHIDDETWFEARAACQGQGADLAQPRDLTILRKELIHRHANWDFWLGGSDLEAEGNWTWLSGNSISGPWRRRQPAGGKRENCLDFRRGTLPQINDYRCDRKQKYICEFNPILRKKEIPSNLSDCTPWCRPPYFMLGNECFSLVHHNRTWEEAKSYCSAEGGALAQPQHLDAISNYLTINIEHGAIKDSGRYWLGGKKRDHRDTEANVCLDLDIHTDNLLSSSMCNETQPFICQAVPESWQTVGSQELLVNDLDKVTWSDAWKICKQSGGRLATIYQHDDFVQTMHTQYRFKSLWVGASNRAAEGEWQWSSGVSLDPDFPWNITISDLGGECMQLSYYAIDQKPMFDSRDCEEKAYFVCDNNTPTTPPHPPELQTLSVTHNSIEIELKPSALHVDTTPVYGYTIYYKPAELSEWEIIQVKASTRNYTFEDLTCGSQYQISAFAYNEDGSGDPSDILNIGTEGSTPEVPEVERSVEPSITSIALDLDAWGDGGCEIDYFVVEYKSWDEVEWIMAHAQMKSAGKYEIIELTPDTGYSIRVTAHNSAGSSVAHYDTTTLTVTEDKDSSIDDENNIEDERDDKEENDEESDNFEDNSLTTDGGTTVTEPTPEIGEEMGNGIEDDEVNVIHHEDEHEDSDNEIPTGVTERDDAEVTQTPPNEIQDEEGEEIITTTVDGDYEVTESPHEDVP